MGLAVVGGFGVAREAGAEEPPSVAAPPNLLPAVPPDPGASAVVADPPAPAARKAAAAPAKAPSLLAPLPSPPAAQAEAYELRRAGGGAGGLFFWGPGLDAGIYPGGSGGLPAPPPSPRFFPWLPYRTNAGTPTLQSLLRGALLAPAPGPGGGRGSKGVAGATSGGIRAYDPAPPYVPAISPFRPDPNEGCRYPKPCFFDAA